MKTIGDKRIKIVNSNKNARFVENGIKTVDEKLYLPIKKVKTQKILSMKKFLAAILILLITGTTTTSCADKKKKNNLDNKKEEVNQSPNEQATIYNPGSQWKLVWADEFDKDTIDANNWNFQVEEAGRFNDEWQRYTNSGINAFVENNCLVIKAKHESVQHGMDQYSSARLHTANKQTWKYGKIVARIKLPKGKGIWPAFWMLGANIDENGGDTPWPQSGEIDILELYGSKDESVVEANIHYANESNSHANMGPASYKLKEGIFADSFHIFELEWDKNDLKWLVDGQQYASTSIASDERSEFQKEFFILLNIAVGGRHAGRPDESTDFPQHMYVDWIRVYQKEK